MKSGAGHICDSDLPLLWLRHRSAAAAPIQPQAQGLPYTTGAAERKNKKTFKTASKKIKKLKTRNKSDKGSKRLNILGTIKH